MLKIEKKKNADIEVAESDIRLHVTAGDIVDVMQESGSKGWRKAEVLLVHDTEDMKVDVIYDDRTKDQNLRATWLRPHLSNLPGVMAPSTEDSRRYEQRKRNTCDELSTTSSFQIGNEVFCRKSINSVYRHGKIMRVHSNGTYDVEIFGVLQHENNCHLRQLRPVPDRSASNPNLAPLHNLPGGSRERTARKSSVFDSENQSPHQPHRLANHPHPNPYPDINKALGTAFNTRGGSNGTHVDPCRRQLTKSTNKTTLVEERTRFDL